MARAKYTKEQAEASRERLLSILKPGDTVYTILKHVSRSGMSRDICPIAIVNGELVHLGYSVAALVGWRCDDQDVKIDGCGMDVGFELVYTLAAALFGDGYKLKQRWI